MPMKRIGILLLLVIWMAVGCGSTTPDRQEQVAEVGAKVMPFDLERTTHIFEKLDSGGLQQVLSDDGDGEQIELIRLHLAEEAERFSQGDFHDPAMIHGEDMAGLHELMMGADRLTIIYSDVAGGGQILYTAEDGELVAALHAWFDQQVANHGAHAQMGRPEQADTTTGEVETEMGMGMMGNNRRIAACNRPNSSSSAKGRLMCRLCRFDQP